MNIHPEFHAASEVRMWKKGGGTMGKAEEEEKEGR